MHVPILLFIFQVFLEIRFKIFDIYNLKRTSVLDEHCRQVEDNLKEIG